MAKKPPIGTVFWIAEEHLYYQSGHAGPLTEYVIYPCKVEGFITGKYTQIKLVGTGPDGYLNVRYYRFGDIGTIALDNPQDAARLAKRYTEDHERRWGWMGDGPLRRPWEKYLQDEKEGQI